jgi:hypothetical protein
VETPITFTTTITRDGTVTITTDDPADFEKGREHIMSIVTAIAGGNPIAYSDCLDPADADAIAHRLARMLLSEVA